MCRTSYSKVNFNIQRDRRPGTIIQDSEYNRTAAQSMPDKGKTGHDLDCRLSRHDKHGLEHRPTGHAYCLIYRPIGRCRVIYWKICTGIRKIRGLECRAWTKQGIAYIQNNVADPGCLSRIPDPDFYPSLIPDPGTKTARKERGKKICCHTFFRCRRKIFGPIFKEL